jgi:hypothetical protein
MSSLTPNRLIGVRAKIERSNQHIKDLETAMRAFRDQNPYGFRIESDPQTGDEIHRVEIRRDTPISLPLVTGDALHNLRSALDHLAWQAHEADGGKPDRQTHFPIRDSAAEYKTADLAKKQKFSPRLIKLFESVQPYQSGYDMLGILHELNNFDKHRLLFVTAFAVSEVMPTWKTLDSVRPFKRLLISGMASGVQGLIITVSGIMGGGKQDFIIHAPVGPQTNGTLSIVQNGAEVGRMLAPVLAKDQAHLNLTLEVAFGEPAVVKGKPVIPFLTQLSQLVDSIVNQFISIL